jgi:hypothetical protein
MDAYKEEFVKENKRVNDLTMKGYEILYKLTEVEQSDVNISIAYYSKGDMRTGFAIQSFSSSLVWPNKENSEDRELKKEEAIKAIKLL